MFEPSELAAVRFVIGSFEIEGWVDPGLSCARVVPAARAAGPFGDTRSGYAAAAPCVACGNDCGIGLALENVTISTRFSDDFVVRASNLMDVGSTPGAPGLAGWLKLLRSHLPHRRMHKVTLITEHSIVIGVVRSAGPRHVLIHRTLHLPAHLPPPGDRAGLLASRVVVVPRRRIFAWSIATDIDFGPPDEVD